MHNTVFVYYVFGRYTRYIPYCIYGILRSYPDSYVKVFVRDELKEREREALEYLPSQQYEIKEHYFDDITFDKKGMIGGNSRVLRWLIPYEELKDFRFAYIGDIDMLIVREFPLHIQHAIHMMNVGLPFSNEVRRGQKRLTGLHFIDVIPYYEAVGPHIDELLSDHAKLNEEVNQCKRNEHFLYNLVRKGVDFDHALQDISTGGTHHFRPHHGAHLGTIRGYGMTDAAYEQLELIPDYLNDEALTKMLEVSPLKEIILLKDYLKKNKLWD